ncbi:MAG: type IA DNA topoisomerase [Boseongicola sp. SB0677_bin_26]|nr:type IA DNA topoisomerase [Boseongicola sp. SB0665_bin_10]MYG26942.1 type IA DNA topoisomerase [Boseongicola sp. SB0677_bin_26]
MTLLASSRPTLVIVEAPGKIPAWSRLAAGLGQPVRIIATGGHFRRFPPRFDPLGIRFEDGAALDYGRQWNEHRHGELTAALQALDASGQILLATDDDMEGDVIALDVLHLVLEVRASLLGQVLRLRPRALSSEAVRQACEAARREPPDEMLLRAVPGRARAIADRWAGALLTGMAGESCGRVRAAVMGLVDDLDRLRDPLPETGEITFQVRASDGGSFFVAHRPFHGNMPPALARLAQRFRNRRIDGTVSPLRPIGAKPAPRFGVALPFNTGDALVHAARFHGIPVGRAMQGLQSAYMKGRVSYPRTDGRHWSEEVAGNVAWMAARAGLNVSGDHPTRPDVAESGAHEGLHPLPEPPGYRPVGETVRRVSRRPETDAEIEETMVALVARRAFESLRVDEWEAGVYAGTGAALSEEEIAALRDLDWLRLPADPRPWGFQALTGVRTWPLDSVLVDLMVRHDVGRPSTLASQVEGILDAGLVSIPDPGRLPEPSPRGRLMIERVPPSARDAETCRTTDRLLFAPVRESLASEADVTNCIGARLRAWLASRPADIQSKLAALVPGAEAMLDDTRNGPAPEEVPGLPVRVEETGALPRPVSDGTGKMRVATSIQEEPPADSAKATPERVSGSISDDPDHRGTPSLEGENPHKLEDDPDESLSDLGF